MDNVFFYTQFTYILALLLGKLIFHSLVNNMTEIYFLYTIKTKYSELHSWRLQFTTFKTFFTTDHKTYLLHLNIADLCIFFTYLH